MKRDSNNLLLLIDGSSYLYRAFHALPPLTNSQGQPTGAIYGVVSMLKKLLADYAPQHIAVVFDSKAKTFRDELYTAYKAHRPTMPDDLIAQIEPLHQVICAMGLPLLMIDGVEADDVIGTLAQQAANCGMDTLISTSDKDLAQLVNTHITLVNTMTNTVLDEKGVKDKFGIPPSLMVDYLCLVGDASDNIPGIPMVGPKTAALWLNQYGSLQAIEAHAAEIKGKQGLNLREHMAQFPLVRDLVTIKCDVPLPYTPQSLTMGTVNKPVLLDLFKKLEFKTWLNELLNEAKTDCTKSVHYHIILDEKTFKAWLKRLQEAELFAIDTETTSLDYLHAQLVGISFALQSGEAAYVPCAHDYLGAPPQLDRNWVLAQIKPLLEDPKPTKLGHNLKYDMSIFANHGIQLQGIAFDSMLESYVFNSADTRHDMDSLALKYLGYATTSFEAIAGKGAKQLTFNQIPLEKAAPYAAEDADITLQLHHYLWPKLKDEPGLAKTFLEIEMPLIPVLSCIERHGVCIDTEMLRQQSTEIAQRLQQLEEEAYALAGQLFNLASPKQLQEVLFTTLKLPILQKTPTGQPSTAEDVLQELALTYPLPKLILEHRGFSKLKSTYTDRLPEQIHPLTGRVHTSYHQAVTATGRLSSSDPNLQNIPIRTEEGRKIRQAFIAPPGYRLLAADYSQIELRIMAHLSQDPGLIQAFQQNRDIHRATAAEIFAVTPETVTDEQRRSAKAINFGLIYGMSAFGLARQLGIDRTAAQHYMDIYFKRYPKVKDYMENTREIARQRGYVETLIGRRLYLPEIQSRNLQRQRAAERAAINAPMQGTAADLIKLAMIQIHAWLQTAKIDAHMIMQVHDELVFEVAIPDLEIAKTQIQTLMSQVLPLSIPLIVDIGIGDNWDQAH